MMNDMVKKGVVYTCITGDYDDPIEHRYRDPDWDYVCFTDNKKLLEFPLVNGWKFCPLFFSDLDSHYNSRWHKLFPNFLFPNYDKSIWVDGSINVLTPKLFHTVATTDKRFLIPSHPWRDCAYEEIRAILQCNKDSPYYCDQIFQFLKSEKFPEHYGLSENNLIFRHHHDEFIRQIMEQWWLLLLRFTKRDQVSLPYLLWKNGRSPEEFAMPNARAPEHFVVQEHRLAPRVSVVKTKRPFFGIEVTPNYHRRCYMFGIRLWSYNSKDRICNQKKSYAIDKKMPTFNFVTSTDRNFGSTRLRVYRIAEYLNRHGFHATVNENDKADIQILQKSDPAFLTDSLIYSKRRGKFLCLDIDDYHESCFNVIIQNADFVIVCSEFLKQQYLPLNRNVTVLDNMIDISNPEMGFPQFNLREPKIGWFGNTTNLSALRRTGVNGVVTITQGGDIPWRLETIDEQLQKFDLILIPQEKNRAGQSKGNCRLLKTIWLGVPTLATDLEPYIRLAKLLRYPDAFLVKDGENWNQRIADVKSGEIPFDFDFRQAREVINQYYGAEVRYNFWLSNVLARYWRRSKMGPAQRCAVFFKTFCFYRKKRTGERRDIYFLEIFHFHYTKRKKS